MSPIFRFLLLFICFAIFGCQSLQHRCQPNQSPSCKSALLLWQENIDYIVRLNFPRDFGKYRAVVWEEEFDNAWVTKGREINITKRFLVKLNPVRRICVAAHELSHLKMGHYYSRVGIIIIDPDTPALSHEKAPANLSSGGHYGSSPSIDLPEGFGVNQEVEADRMALKIITQLGLSKKHYLDMLLLLQGRKVDPTTLIYHRIDMIKKVK